VLVVSDNGLGLPAEDGAARPSTGLGQRIIAGLVEQLQATMTVDGLRGLRTEIHIAAPVAV
jgi:two-component sensor histidine kinase